MNLIRNIVGIIIIIVLLPTCIESFKYTSEIKFDYNQINDEIALYQLRDILLIAYDMHVTNNKITFIYKNKEFTLSLVNKKLLLQPGTQIFLNDIDNLYLKERNNCIYVVYERQDKQYERILCKKEGFYLDNFSNCDVRNDDDSEYEE